MRRIVMLSIPLLLVASACRASSSSPPAEEVVAGPGDIAVRSEPSSAAPPEHAKPSDHLSVTALVESGGALVALEPGTAGPRWSLPGGRASADGTVAYAVEGGNQLVQFDTDTGTAIEQWVLPAGPAWHLGVVSSDGATVVMTDGPVSAASPRTTTTFAVWSERSPKQVKVFEQRGRLEPEALSPTGDRLYVLDHRRDYYRVRTFDIGRGMLYDTIDRDKANPPDDMHGTAVRSSLSPDRSVLSTLYRVDPEHGHGPFVHLLNLSMGFSYCADLPPGDYSAITTAPDGRSVYVGARDSSWVTIDIRGMDTPAPGKLALERHAAGTPSVPLSPQGSILTGTLAVAADPGGVTWSAGSGPTARVAHPVDRLMAIKP